MEKKNTCQMINIPRTVNDQFYRYQMPEINITHERGVKTTFNNLQKIAKSLKCLPIHISKYFEYHIGVQCVSKNDTYCFNGIHDRQLLSKHLDTFIERFILCQKCRLPEIRISKTLTKIKKTCNACGDKEFILPNTKFERFMYNNV